MAQESAHLTLKLDTHEPIELSDFVGAFVSLANEFERFLAEKQDALRADPKIYIREVRAGCIEADIVAGLQLSAAMGMAGVSHAMLLEDFVKRWGARLQIAISGRFQPGEMESKAELNDFLKTVRSISEDPRASHRLEAATFEDGARRVVAAFQFTSADARSAEINLQDRTTALTRSTSGRHERVLMRFTRTDIHDAKLNKRSADRVVISEIAEQDVPVMYASAVAEAEIRQYIRESEGNAYKLGFVVDVAAKATEGGVLQVYAVLALHSVIELD